jgi:hypothetical protein
MNRRAGLIIIVAAHLAALLCYRSAANDNGAENPSATASESNRQTAVAINQTIWLINDKPAHSGAAAEGLLLNVRMVNTVFEDTSNQIDRLMPGFDPEENSTRFINKLPDYVANGVAAITVSLQGGMPGYEGAINSAFHADGSLRRDYLSRVQRVIEACDRQGVVVILSCLYQRQHSHDHALAGREAIMEAIANVARWIQDQKFTNVLLEVSNEYAHAGFRRWHDGEWLRSDDAQVELIRHAKTVAPELLVSTSGMGSGRISDAVGDAADFITIHFNNTSLEDIPIRVKEAQRFGKPVICNEDDKLGDAAVTAMRLSLKNGAGWGFMHQKKNQHYPFEFEGAQDDPKVYAAMRELATQRSIGDEPATPPSPTRRLVVITSPTDGQLLNQGRQVTITASLAGINAADVGAVQFLADDKVIGRAEQEPWQLTWRPHAGKYDLTAVVVDKAGKELQRSKPVDVEVQ